MNDSFIDLFLLEQNKTSDDKNSTEIIYNIKDVFGPQRDSLAIVIPITIIYALIFITGVIGNISTCIVIKKNRLMHTATNYYLFSLAISDFMLLLSGVPQEMYFMWSKYPYIFGEIFCIGRGFVAETSANATILTITAFTIERYVAICHPFFAQTMSKLSRAAKTIILIWLTSFIAAVPQAAQFGLVKPLGITQCAVVRIVIRHSFQLSTFIFFLAPMSMILVLYSLIGLKLHRTAHVRSERGSFLNRNSNPGRSQKYQAGTNRVLKMLVAVVIAFFICWAPFHAQRLIAVYGVDNKQQGQRDPLMVTLYTAMTYISGVLYYLSTCINPLLYNIMSNKFRAAFKATLAGCKIGPSRKHKPKYKYNFLTRDRLLQPVYQESTDFTSYSQREESSQSTTSWRYNYSVTTSKENTKINNIKFEKPLTIDNYINENENQNDIIIKTDSIDLPSKDAKLNVLYLEKGEIKIKLKMKNEMNNRRKQEQNYWKNMRKLFKFHTNRPHIDFSTPPLNESLSSGDFNLHRYSSNFYYDNNTKDSLCKINGAADSF